MLNTLVTRRAMLQASASFALASQLPRITVANNQRLVDIKLTAASTALPLVGRGYPETAVWAFNGKVPGPEIRVRQGDRLRVTVENKLDQETSVHWHGIRLPNAMDGVPHLTQPPIAPGESFVYEFEPPDAGTFWYHPHINSSEQVGRGLYGALIVEEPNRSPADDSDDSGGFDRELVWVLDDWRIDKTATIAPFTNGHDVSHGGRVGSFVTVNGRLPEALAVRAGERLRLRLINVANARHFALRFEGHNPQIIAYDGQPVEPHAPDNELVVLAPAMRVDLLLDCSGQPSRKTKVVDSFYRNTYQFSELSYSDEAPLRPSQSLPPISLPANPLPEPDIANAERHEIVFAGGAMGGMRGASMNGRYTDIRTMVRSGIIWAVNGVAATEQVSEPLLTLKRGQSTIFTIRNDTAFPHPIHLHGHHYRVISRNGKATRHREWQDSVLIMQREQAEVAFVADNPGDWMFHCHIPEHMAAGMMAVIKVA